MKRPIPMRVVLVLSVALVACTASPGSPSAVPEVVSAEPSVDLGSPDLTPQPSASPSPGSPAPEPTTGLAPFTCALPASLPATVDRAQIADVRVGSHGSGASGYDRIVFEFQGAGIPEVLLGAGTPPFTRDPSDLPLPVRGTSFLVLVLRGATAVTPVGTITYGGPTDFTPGFPALTELKEGGDFEAVSTWVAGLAGPTCHRLFVLTNPTRLVIDLEHPRG